ncbi:MAG: YeeE/YedE thiosulfate transporter family protein [Gemmatimonadota bacterium]
MNAPLYPHGVFGAGASLWIALAIGIAFGACLERAGFGSARKLVAQFYLTDLAVFKVMFTAIITAMTGVLLLSTAGLLDRSLLAVPPTFLLPQVVGGLLFGVGFVVGGYCPGTSCVGAVTGRGDALVLWLGMIVGVLIFGEAFAMLETFYNATDLGALTLPMLFHLPYPLIVVLVVMMALFGFRVAGWIERKHRAPSAIL